MSNIYHKLYNEPVFEPGEMYIELEELAKKIVASGKLRIDAVPASNCARVTVPELGVSLAFSKRELEDKQLVNFTRNFILSLWQRKYHNNPSKATNEAVKTMALLKADLAKKVPLSEELEMKIARIIVQTIHPVVVNLLIIDQVEFFVTYGYTIGDMLDVPTWKSSGQNSGMQTTDGRDSAVFISCGGDPFGETDNDNPTFGDGKPALARMMVIGAQEMGHFSDIKRDSYARQISRYSADFAGTKASDIARIGRVNDIKTCLKLKDIFTQCNIDGLLTTENAIMFYKKQKKFISYLWNLFVHQFKKRIFLNKLKKYQIYISPLLFKNDKLIAKALLQMLDDMMFNLEPQADVYKRSNPQEEEAVACIEALARVPQQVIKWGFAGTKLFMPNLYKLYYNEVIPGCIRSYETLACKKYRNKLTLPPFFTIVRIKNSAKRALLALFKKSYKE